MEDWLRYIYVVLVALFLVVAAWSFFIWRELDNISDFVDKMEVYTEPRPKQGHGNPQ